MRKLPVWGHGTGVRILFFTALLSLLADSVSCADQQSMIAQSIHQETSRHAVRYKTDFTMIAQSFKQNISLLSVV
ncbi:hypothetical protein F7R01_08335 [Pseudomonas argentinensis]|uniref:hypothetical protein n=1 Tax=Phytopseudomonas argentinensis TaxID=289370 RepID=UPI001113D2AA|nr:hypothetical protein [Pseudomonas argentinensis]KAB0551196.1 hypothetical protein F7R01_08335 [Pseudomonas argentinensis]